MSVLQGWSRLVRRQLAALVVIGLAVALCPLLASPAHAANVVDSTVRPVAVTPMKAGDPLTVFVSLPKGATNVVLLKRTATGTSTVRSLSDSGYAPDRSAYDSVFSGSTTVAQGTPMLVRYRLGTATWDSAPLRYESSVLPQAPKLPDVSSVQPFPFKPGKLTAAGSAVCKLDISTVPNCESTHQTPQVYFVHWGDTTKCSFTVDADWGDGTKSRHTAAGQNGGKSLLASHSYSVPRAYAIKVTKVSVSGPCSITNGSYRFNLRGTATAEACVKNLNVHGGRTLMYAMKPIGNLKRADGTVENRFAYNINGNNDYFDAAGVKWRLMPAYASKAHQPAWWQLTLSAPWDGGAYKKFVAVDSTGGSFEAVLKPDNAPADGSKPPAGTVFSYSTKWLLNGAGMPTYNYVDESSSVWGHFKYDYFTHTDYDGNGDGVADLDSGYAAPRVWIDPRTSDWRTYATRLAEVKRLVQVEGYRYSATVPPTLVKGTSKRTLTPDLAWIAKDMSTCANLGIKG